MANIFEILGILPTTDYETVIKAVAARNITENPDLTESDKSFCRVLQQAWSQINTPDKFAAFVASLGDTPHASPAATLPGAAAADVTVYVLVTWYALESESNSEDEAIETLRNLKQQGESSPLFIPPPHDGSTQVDGKELVTFINAKFSDHHMLTQVGMSAKEAIAINNQHSHRDKQLVVGIRIPSTQLNDTKSTERQCAGTTMLNAKYRNKYSTIKPGTSITIKDIVSIELIPLFEYANTMRPSARLDLTSRYEGTQFTWKAAAQLHDDTADPERSLTAVKPTSARIFTARTKHNNPNTGSTAGKNTGSTAGKYLGL